MSLMYDKQVKFINILGQGRVNQLGGMFINGKPLPTYVRLKIIELAKNGVKPCNISRQLKVSHGAVSKILNRFAETGSVSPRQVHGSLKSRISINYIEKDVANIMKLNPNYNANDIRMKLIANKICTDETVPSLTSIKKLIKIIEFKKVADSCSTEKSKKLSLNNELPFSIDKILSVNTKSSENNKKNDEKISFDKSPTRSYEGRRNRTSFNAQQLKALENLFSINTYPNPEEREKLSKITNLSEEKIMTWFSNRRARYRKNLSFNTSDHQDYIISPVLSTNNGFSPIPPSTSMTPLSINTTNNCTQYFGNNSTSPSSHIVRTPYFYMNQYQKKFFPESNVPVISLSNGSFQNYNLIGL